MQKPRNNYDTEKSILIIISVCAVLYFGSLSPAMQPWVPTFYLAIKFGIGCIGLLLFVALLRYLGRPKYMTQRPAQRHATSTRGES